MTDRHLYGWNRRRDEHGSWAGWPRPARVRPPAADQHPRSAPSPLPRSAASPRSAPSAQPAPQVVPLGGDLALVSVGQWDEESATTIQMPAIRDEPPSAPGPDPSREGRG